MGEDGFSSYGQLFGSLLYSIGMTRTYLAQLVELKMDRGAKSSSKVTWAGADVSESFAPGKLMAMLLHQSFNLTILHNNE